MLGGIGVGISRITRSLPAGIVVGALCALGSPGSSSAWAARLVIKNLTLPAGTGGAQGRARRIVMPRKLTLKLHFETAQDAANARQALDDQHQRNPIFQLNREFENEHKGSKTITYKIRRQTKNGKNHNATTTPENVLSVVKGALKQSGLKKLDVRVAGKDGIRDPLVHEATKEVPKEAIANAKARLAELTQDLKSSLAWEKASFVSGSPEGLSPDEIVQSVREHGGVTVSADALFTAPLIEPLK